MDPAADDMRDSEGHGSEPRLGSNESKSGVTRVWFRLARGGNVLMAGAASGIGAYLAFGWTKGPALIGAILAPILIAAGGNIDNDICDLAIDRQIKPDRPVAAGTIRIGAARLVAALLFVAGVIVALLSGWMPALVAVGVVILLWLYNRRLSGVPVAGNVVIAVIGAMPILYGAICTGGRDPSLWRLPAAGAAIAFWLHLAREILKDVTDQEGDLIVGRRTLAIALGPRVAIRLAAFIMLVGAGFVLWPGIEHWFGHLYLFGVIVTVIPALILGAAQCGVNPNLYLASQWSFGLKLCMAAGLVWMAVDRLAH